MSSGFVTESEAAEARRKRQEEWERVRKTDDPIEAPEEVFDRRSLYERLQEQKQKKDLEYEEAHKLKNMIKGLDDDEIEFLDLVDRTKLAAERMKNIDEERELNDYRNRVASLQEKTIDQRLQAEIIPTKKVVTVTRNSQQQLLKGAVKRKISDVDSEPKQKINNTVDVQESNKQQKTKSSEDKTNHVEKIKDKEHTQGALRCIGILPGLGCYNDSSDSDVSSDSEEDNIKVDMLGRKFKKKKDDEAT